VPTEGVLRAAFVASPGYCWDIQGSPAGEWCGAVRFGAVGAGHQLQDARPRPGRGRVHRVGVQAEGVLRGCNTGALVIWAALALTVSGVNAADAKVVLGIRVWCGR